MNTVCQRAILFNNENIQTKKNNVENWNLKNCYSFLIYAAAAAAAVKSLQSCPTLCDPIDGSPPGSPCPWDSPSKNTGMGCHSLLQCMKVKSESEVAQSCPTLSDPMDCSPPGSSIHGLFQARVLEWLAIAFSGGSSWPKGPVTKWPIIWVNFLKQRASSKWSALFHPEARTAN